MKREYLDKLYCKLHFVKQRQEEHAEIKEFDGDCAAGIHRAVKNQLEIQHSTIVEIIDDYIAAHCA